MSQIYRIHCRAQMKENVSEQTLAPCIEQCINSVRLLQKSGALLTAALYRYGRMLFLYYEAVGECVRTVEPIVASQTPEGGLPLESGEDIQASIPRPEDFLSPLLPFLMLWPGQEKERYFVHMYHIFYHSIPETADSWERAAVPAQRRGRIAFLREDKLFGYVYYHKGLVEEGLIKGDRYQSIALHENILFSYFEEPKTITNIQNDSSRESAVLKQWVEQDPESHFIHMPGSGGENFLFIPALFALGREDLKDEQI